MSCRIDKWLWCVRLCKTRSTASEECRKNHVLVDGTAVKAAREIKIGDVVSIKRPPVVYSYKVLGFPASRVGAKLVEQYLLDVTPPEMRAVEQVIHDERTMNRPKGMGRPTKKDRRDIEDFFEMD